MTDPRALIEECRDALAEELAGWDLDPPLHHVKQAHDRCVAWLAQPEPTPTPSAPDGWKLVPIELTPEMVGAMAVEEATGKINGTPTIGMAGAALAWESALAAAPLPPTPSAEPVAEVESWTMPIIECYGDCRIGDPLKCSSPCNFAGRPRPAAPAAGEPIPPLTFEQRAALYHEGVAKRCATPTQEPAGQVSDEQLRIGVRAFQSGHNGSDDLSDWRAFYNAVERARATRGADTQGAPDER